MAIRFEKTLIILKPDAVARGFMGRIIDRFEQKGLRIVGMKMMTIKPAFAKKHYAEHKGKPFYNGLLKFITGGPVVVMAIEGKGAVAVCRKMMGATFGSKAEPGTIRGDFGVSDSFNLVHGSDSVKSARRELALYFKPSELVKYNSDDLKWTYDLAGE